MKKFLAAIMAIAMVCSLAVGVITVSAAEEDYADKVIAVIDHEITETDWESAHAYELTPLSEGTSGATGTVKLLVTGTRLYFRFDVADATRQDADRPEYSITVGGKTQSARGKFVDVGTGNPWLADSANEFGQALETTASYEDGKYVLSMGFDIGEELCVTGAHVQVSFSAADAQEEGFTWQDNTTSYPHAIGFSDTLYIGAYSETDPVEPTEPEPEPEPDPEPIPGPDNEDLKIVVTDLPSMPTEADWEKATAYEMLPLYGNIPGATGTVKVYTAATNIYFRMEVEDPTTHIGNDGVYVYLGIEGCRIETRGNYDNWLNNEFSDGAHNDLGQPSLLDEKTTASEMKGYVAGKYTFDYGFYIPEIYEPGATIRLNVRHRDSRNSKEVWTDGDYKSTIYFDQILTFGEKADTTIRPQEPTEGFTASVTDISYNQAAANWSEFANAETYRFYVYEVNEAGAEEPYTHLSIEGPIYAGQASYKETFRGLSATTKYAIQVVAYDASDNAIAYSELAEFTTISREEALNPDPGPGDNPGGNPGEQEPEESGGCSGAVTGGAVALSVLLIGGAAAAAIKRRKA